MNIPGSDKQDRILAELRADFLADARERIELIEDALRDGHDAAALVTVRREVHNLKGMGGSFGFPVVGLIAHRMEDYLGALQTLDPRHATDALAFLRCIQAIIETGHDPDDAETAALVRSLPVPPGAGTAEDADAVLDAEILLVCPSRAMSHFALRGLRALGCRVTTARSASEAMEIAVRARPDLVVTSAVLDGIDGVDLARALAAMRATATLPVAVLTSFAPDHAALRELPAGVPTVHLDERLQGRIAEIIGQGRSG